MIQSRPGMFCGAAVAVLLTGLGTNVYAAEAPPLKELRVQKMGDATYFQARFDEPKDLRMPPLDRFWWTDAQRTALARLPELVPQDEKTRSVYYRLDRDNMQRFNFIRNEKDIDPPVVVGVEFVGKVTGAGEAKFTLLYPTQTEVEVPVKGQDGEKKTRTVRKRTWVEVPVTIDLEKAQKVAVPEGAFKRNNTRWPGQDDLEGIWAVGQAVRFAVLEGQTNDFGFYSFAREATGRKYNVPTPQLFGGRFNHREFLDRRLYETTTGAAAIAESLQIHRMLNRDFRDKGERNIEIAKVPGITIGEHPWEKMMAGKKPAAEPLAKLVPNDNYYIHFKNFSKLVELGDLMDLWGTSLTRAYEVNSRDYQLKQRYEKQLCLRSTFLGKTFGPTIIKSLSVTGSDIYLREGSDVTLIFHVVNKQLFYLAVDRFIKEARDEYKGKLQESKDKYNGIEVESFVTPQREVSLHRATLGEDYVIYSNSQAGIRRVIDTHLGKHKSLAEMLDFQYMRTIFSLDEEDEHGFVYLSDAFIRQIVGPASKIKEKRRMEAMTSLYMETNGALFTAWETGKLPDSKKLLLASSTLKAEEIYMPDGKEVVWDERSNLAVSDVYNTIHFATPLIELPIDKVSRDEEQSYLRFRAEYMGLWRGFFDPIGMRFSLKDKQIKVDTYILPLIQNSQYNDLRRLTGNGTAKLDPASIPSKTLAQFSAHIAPDAREREFLAAGLRDFMGKGKKLDWLGDWFIIRLDDSPVYGKLAELAMRRELDPEDNSVNWQEETNLFFQIPLTLGVEIKQPLVFAGLLAAVRTAVTTAAPDTVEWEPMDPKYRGSTIVRIQDKGAIRGLTGTDTKAALYYATVNGVFYLSLQEQPIKNLIDHAVDLNEGKIKKGEEVAINSSLYLSPSAADASGTFLRSYLEWETHRRALNNAPVWYALFRSGIVNEKSDEKALNAAAMSFFGFLPVAADNSTYTFDPKSDEVINKRHGTLRKPTMKGSIEKDSPLNQMLEQFRSIRTDLRFREDGVHTVLTIERKTP